MSAKGRLVVYITFNVDVKKVGDLQGINQDLQGLKQRFESVKDVQIDSVQATEQQSSSMRRLAMDLRMMSIGLFILRREFGETSGPINTTTKSLYIFSAGVSAALGTYNLMADLPRKLKEFGGVSGIISKLTGDFDALSLAGKAFSLVAAGFIGLAVGTWIGEQISGISSLREQIRGWTKDLEDLKIAQQELSAQQAALNEEASWYQLQIDKLKTAIDLQGYATPKQTRDLNSLEAQLKRTKLATSELNYDMAVNAATTARYGAETAKAEKGIAQVEQSVWGGDAFRRLWQTVVTKGMIPLNPPTIPTKQLGGEIRTPGAYYLERGEVYQREGAIAALAGAAGGPGPISVNMSFPSAVFTSGEDIEESLRRGGAAAGAEIRRQLDYMRYGVKAR